MTTSEPTRAFVWIWLPGETTPVVAGRLDQRDTIVTFTYGRSYLENENAIAIYLPELPLARGEIAPRVGAVAGCISDASPDSWGRRVILNRHVGRGIVDNEDLGILTWLLESGSDRTGALDFQRSPTDYEPRSTAHPSLEELMESAEKVEMGIPLSPDLDQALLHGTSVGGARPKALLIDRDRRLIAKFSSTTDTYSVVKGEFVAMELARRAGLNVAAVEIVGVLGRDVLLADRFDRDQDGARRAMVSALTILGLEDFAGRHASYADFADQVRARFVDPGPTLRELFARLTFNILTGNTDDHGRNHAGFWDGSMLSLTPAFDICPQPRSGREASQGMIIGADGYRLSQVAGCVGRAATFHLDETEARDIALQQVELIQTDWLEVCGLAGMTEVERIGFWHRQFLNPFALEGL